MTWQQIKKKLEELNIYHPSLLPAIHQLIDVDSSLKEIRKTLKKDGFSIKTTSREGADRIVPHPLLNELNKMEITKANILNSLMLTPASLKRNGVEIQPTKDDDFDDALKKRVDNIETVKTNKRK
ncbi:P27 family phage terminase small subunit [Carboxylicivirga sp. RSCT41]|uniref:P27 family phage terminase small subunit n=1 Tax=Carboxylicivirga agarovorans TaxID=3417570 RepID=UPI003D350930